MSMDGNDYQEGYEEGVSSQLEEVSKLEKLLSESERRGSSLEAEIESLKAKLAAQGWHDASELPKEEGQYLITVDTTNIVFVHPCLHYALDRLKNCINGCAWQTKIDKKKLRWMKIPDWCKITSPEGK
jgi:hypothetical protein